MTSIFQDCVANSKLDNTEHQAAAVLQQPERTNMLVKQAQIQGEATLDDSNTSLEC